MRSQLELSLAKGPTLDPELLPAAEPPVAPISGERLSSMESTIAVGGLGATQIAALTVSGR
ncbi:MAG: hypothetical protein IPK00_24305 [Deltaproteobacteria bacterium]|nr:hypothetical protein [Deltaproteobacteria bacterium]